MEDNSSSDISYLLEHMPAEDKKKFPRQGNLSFNFSKYSGSYRISMGECLNEVYVPYSVRPMREIPEGKNIEDIISDELSYLGENVAYFNIFLNSSMYKQAVTPFKMPE